MDMVAACRAFVSVSSHGSFTAGAAAAQIPQSVASRRIAALEQHFGVRLLDRTSRTAVLTPFGRDMLPAARRLIELAEAMDLEAERARRRPLRVAVPATCGPLPLARLVAGGQQCGLNLDLHPAGPRERAELARTQEVRAALAAVPADRGRWRIPLGLADTRGPHVSPIYLETLRASRADRDGRRRRIWIQPEDDVPHIRDRLVRLRDSLGLQPVQVVVGEALVTAVAEVLGSTDLLLCSPAQAAEFGLAWRPIGELEPARGYDIQAGQHEDAERLRALPSALIGRCLGVPDDGAGGDGSAGEHGS
ncbi:LysR family transcriptional regulator [Nocardia sp. NEAU-G5]|uniref:LysR family transcriptional regulator n=2 Tax=Nocardia albiluteola TaxID=2842303 RepID=A0ABS6B463_9NOCA|nr:LysR family transcriptional regulator [Nocardia albiluteola]